MPKQVYLVLIILLGLSTGLSAQLMLKGKVLDQGDQQPLPFVNITLGKSQYGTSTDIDGRFELRIPKNQSSTLHLSYIGYQEKSVEISPEDTAGLVIQMQQTTEQLSEVTVLPGENPAHRIIKNAVDKRAENNPENLPSFSYQTYSKFVATVNTDSVDPSIDTVYHEENTDSIVKVDSSNYRLVKFMERQHLFFMESVTERNYLKGKRDNEKVLASRTSGFKEPRFSLLITELQSFSFYSDYISIAGNDFLNPLTPGSTNRYFFLMQDTAYNSPTDTVFVISYRPKPNYGFKPIQGVLYINSSSWAVQNAIARPVETSGMQIEIEQKYKRYGEDTWFPEQLNANLILGNVRVGNVTPVARMRTYLKEVKIGQELRKKDISRATVSIASEAVDKSPEILNQYRIDSLDEREKYTYNFMDSISEAENLEGRLKWFIALASGKVKLGPIDWEIDKLIRGNRHEGLRPGIGIRTNDQLLEWFNVGAYLGYGFRDEEFKYSLDGELTLHKHTNLKLLGGYRFDLFETGGIDFVQTERGSFWANNYRQFFISQLDRTYRSFAGLTYDPLVNLKLRVVGRHEDRDVIGNYRYAPHLAQELPGDKFQFSELITSLSWSPKQDFVEGPGFGRISLERAFPVIHLQYTRGIDALWGSDFSYNKIDLRLDHQFKTLFLGDISLRLQSGLVMDDVPYSKLYVGTANLLEKEDFFDRMRVIADRQSFETMRFNEFLSGRYVQFMFRQDLKTLLFRRENFAPHIEWVARALWGGLNSPENHQGVSFKSPVHGYYETGLEVNRIIKESISSIGIGFYYRLGPYSLPSFEENFALKLTSKFQL